MRQSVQLGVDNQWWLLMLAAWAGYEEEEIPDRSGPVMMGDARLPS